MPGSILPEYVNAEATVPDQLGVPGSAMLPVPLAQARKNGDETSLENAEATVPDQLGVPGSAMLPVPLAQARKNGDET
jgi:hypothetical protein